MIKATKNANSETAVQADEENSKPVFGFDRRERIPVTQPYLPDRAKFQRYVDGIFTRNWHTNNGPLVRKLTDCLKEYLGVENLLLVSNGTLALQIVYRVLGVCDGKNPEAITTPFSFVATASTLKWEGITPVFADIDANSFCLNPDNIAHSVSNNTKAIVPVHVYGNCCDVEAIEKTAREQNLKTIYDGAHAFGVRFKGESVFNRGDATTLSFHATKLFHTCEGGAIVFRKQEDLEKAKLLINFGIEGPEIVGSLGINAKMSEIHAAMGLCVLDDIDDILNARASASYSYERMLGNYFKLPEWNPDATRNFAYFPIVFESQKEVLAGKKALEKLGIGTRRYFYPSLDTLSYLQPQPEQPVSRNIVQRVLCLPLPAPDLDLNDLKSALNLERG
ncbi:MAG: DegT/DnrJ/EryC1/StrS family aminotransferase [Alphaproteobacteria bacterium]|nr:DegT/DnrJ/EryC1/StrS family aminotransferase [Alphaproteobacteria bacterium]